jgi:hypothetical protein
MFLTDTELGGVPPEEATVDLGPFDLDMLGSMASGRVRGAGQGGGTTLRALRAELSKEVARIASLVRRVRVLRV